MNERELPADLPRFPRVNVLGVAVGVGGLNLTSGLGRPLEATLYI